MRERERERERVCHELMEVEVEVEVYRQVGVLLLYRQSERPGGLW